MVKVYPPNVENRANWGKIANYPLQSSTKIDTPAIRTWQNFLINGPLGGDRFDTLLSNVNNSRTTKDKKSVLARREAQFSDKKSKLYVIVFPTLIFN